MTRCYVQENNRKRALMCLAKAAGGVTHAGRVKWSTRLVMEGKHQDTERYANYTELCCMGGISDDRKVHGETTINSITWALCFG